MPFDPSLIPQFVHNSVEHGECRAALEDPLRSLAVSSLALIPSLSRRKFERHQRRRASVRGSGSRLLLSRQHGRQKPEFRLHFARIGDSVRDFLAKEFAIPLAKPVNGHLERPF
jgi:hypothetical protein